MSLEKRKGSAIVPAKQVGEVETIPHLPKGTNFYSALA